MEQSPYVRLDLLSGEEKDPMIANSFSSEGPIEFITVFSNALVWSECVIE